MGILKGTAYAWVYISVLIVFLSDKAFTNGMKQQNQPRYSIVDLGCLPNDQSSQVIAINDETQILGSSWRTVGTKGEDWKSRMFLWQAGKFYDLGNFSARGLNDKGIVVGQRLRYAKRKEPSIAACVYAHSLRDLTCSSDTVLSIANAINNQGEIVGKELGIAPPRKAAYRWGIKSGRLETPEGYVSCEAFAINDVGCISGAAEKLTPSGTSLLSRAVLWKNGQVAILDLLKGYDESTTIAMNNVGLTVGYCFRGNDNGDISQQACLWSGKDAQDLGSLGRNQLSIARAVNDTGQIVGNAGVPQGDLMHAFLWQNGHMTDLNKLVVSHESGWILANASGINKVGQIICNGWRNGSMHALLLTPIR